jgi:hypothetical protein
MHLSPHCVLNQQASIWQITNKQKSTSKSLELLEYVTQFNKSNAVIIRLANADKIIHALSVPN